MVNFTHKSFYKKMLGFLIIIILASCSLPDFGDNVPASSIQLVAPQSGSQFAVGDEVSVLSNYSDPGGAQGAMLEVNGIVLRDDRFFSPIFNGSIDQPWRAQESGSHTLCVYLRTSDGVQIKSNCASVIVGSSPELQTPVTGAVTPSPVAIVTPAQSATQDIPSITADQNANCRQGPGVAYAVTFNLLKGQSAPIVGKNTDNSWWVIQVPGGADCWIWDGTVTVGGDIAGVLVITPPPAPVATETKITPLSAPSPSSPGGTQNCADASGGVNLIWSAVTHPNGIDHYEWSLEGPVSDSGNTAATQAFTKSLSCAGANFQWRVRAVDGQGNIGPWSAYLQFNIP